MKTKPVLFNNTVLRDGHQSMAATRMATSQMLEPAPILDEMGFAGLETWGGATIDSCLRFLKENPFDRLRTLKKIAPKTPQLMLLRGQNIVQYASFPDDVVEAFVRLTCENGQDILRIFDALNDVRNLATSIKTTKKCGKHARGELCYTISPVHTVENFVKMGVELEKMGCDSIGIKDMSGILQPQIAHRMVKELKGKVGIPITLHTHDTAGLGAASYLAAIDAGVDCVEVSIAPFANGTSQPDTQRMLALLEGHPRCPKFDTQKLAKLRDYFEGVYKELAKFTSPANERVDSDILIYQVPGGMLSNFRTQLKEQGMADKFDEVVKEILVVREALGWIPLVTPTSQIVGTQAMMNVKFGRWKMICQPAQDIALGKYGLTPGPINSGVLTQVEKQTGKKPVTMRPADLLEPGMEKYRKQCAEKGLPTTDEIVVLFAMFPQQVEELIKPKAVPVAPTAPTAPAATLTPPPTTTHTSGPGRHLFVTVNGTRHDVTVETLES
ncbi:MAG: pyruvate carboxylase subunit B [Verrucomicrobiota bacterium]|jgi:oxaloacetate decarboxylase alpha subunit/pyruvate carboxylase subunit B